MQYLGTSFGLTDPLLNFWIKSGYQTVYLRQTPSEVTGEFTCLMLKSLDDTNTAWLDAFVKEFKKRFVSLLG